MHFRFKDRQVKKDTSKNGKKKYLYIILLFLFNAIKNLSDFLFDITIIITQNGAVMIFMTLVTFFY